MTITITHLYVVISALSSLVVLGAAALMALEHRWRWHQWPPTDEWRGAVVAAVITGSLSGLAVLQLIKFAFWLAEKLHA